MLLGAPADPLNALVPIAPPTEHDLTMAHLQHVHCMQRRLECLIQRNRGLTFVGAFLAAGLAIWLFSPKPCPR